MGKSRLMWDKKLWGILFTGADGESMLLGNIWHDEGSPYPGEPTRALLFQTRAQAREWHANQRWSWRRNYRVVRVWETVNLDE